VRILRGIGLWQIWLALGAALVAGYMLLADQYANLYYNAISLVTVILIVVGVRRNRPSRPRIWYYFATGQALWAIGDFVYGYYVYVLETDPFPSIADGFYLAGYPFLAVSLFILIRGRTSGRDRVGLIDASIIATSLGLLSWVFIMRDIAADESLSLAARLISLGYPVVDLLLLMMVARLFTSPGARTASYRLFAGGLLVLLGSDITYSVLTTFYEYSGGLFDLGWLTAYVLWGTAALHPSMRSLSEVAPDRAARISPWRLRLLAAVSLLAPALLFQQGLKDPGQVDWVAIGIGCVALFLLVLARMSGLIAQVQDQATQLAALAHNDALTGVPNRRAWDLELAREMAIARRTGFPLSVAMLDLDHFKRFNDHHGHQAGDRLLTQSAALWRAQLRDQDYLARYGGEEFCVMVTGRTAAAAVEVIERLLGSTPDGQTFSAGLADWDGVESPESLVARTDEALYHAKRAGRNRVTLAQPTVHQVRAERSGTESSAPNLDLQSAIAGR
jgi:diguanylate cyclase (GGDEF)-like protein